jgi:hypothetical protein
MVASGPELGLMSFDICIRIITNTSLASPTPSNNIRPIHASTPDRKKNIRTKENAPLGIFSFDGFGL